MLKRDIQPYIEDLRARRVTNRAVAKVLGVSEAHLSRVLRTLGVVKDPANDRQLQHELAVARKLFRADLASKLPASQAAKLAKCSERTIYRYKNDTKKL